MKLTPGWCHECAASHNIRQDLVLLRRLLGIVNFNNILGSTLFQFTKIPTYINVNIAKVGITLSKKCYCAEILSPKKFTAKLENLRKQTLSYKKAAP